jgi:hypothetical protein
MGLVYEAHRVDGEVRQRVAVKFAQVSSNATPEMRASVRRRFLRERQVLASLQHPYIAGLIDAGTTAEGIPYAVIEQVDGVALDTYCEMHGIDEPGRIGLVLKICEAVQFAHRNLIVHSDLKPENVLVTTDGVPKLIDFGISNDLGEDATITVMSAFTPGYSSPEQSDGAAPTVASDVWGLGALLYRLLTGSKPRQTTSGSLAEVIRAISEEDVTRPSAISRHLIGDLENILMKALQREPRRRYGSVPEFADDLRRYLARMPVRATPDSILYRANRFIRRQRLPLFAAALLVIALASTLLGVIRQRETAVRRALETRRLADRLLFEVYDEIKGVAGGTKAREKLGAIAVEYLEGLRRDPEMAWELLNAYARLSQSRAGAESSVGDTESGLRFASKALELGAVVERAAMDPARLERLFAVYSGVAPIFQQARKPRMQLEAIERMLRIAERLGPLRQAQAYKEFARYCDTNDQAVRSAEAYAKAVEILRPLAPESREAASQLSSAMVGLGRAQALAGDYWGAVQTLQDVIRAAGSALEADPNNVKTARQLYWSYIALGDVYGSPFRFGLGRPKEAAAHYDKARQIADGLLKADPANEVAKLDLSRSYSRYGAVLASSEPEKSLTLLGCSYRLALETSARNQSGLESRLDYLTASVIPLVALGRIEQAKTHTAEARLLLARIAPEGSAPLERSILRAEAAHLYRSGHVREAIEKSQRQIALLPARALPVLSDNFELVDALERIRLYAAGLEGETYRSATERLAKLWMEIQARHEKSAFVRSQVQRARSMCGKACVSEPGEPSRASAAPSRPTALPRRVEFARAERPDRLP